MRDWPNEYDWFALAISIVITVGAAVWMFQ